MLDTLAIKAAGLGAISGIRAAASPALLARAARRGELGGLSDTPFAALGSDRIAALLTVLMIGEMIGDKTPFIPARTSVPAVLGRALSGALVGSALFVSGKRPGVSGALLGVSSALVGVYAIDGLRSYATQSIGVPDPAFGLLEDALVLFGGRSLLQSGEAQTPKRFRVFRTESR